MKSRAGGKSTWVPLSSRVFAFYEEGPLGWSFVDSLTIGDLGWGTAAERRALNATGTVRRISRLAVGETHIEDRGLAGRTKYKRLQ